MAIIDHIKDFISSKSKSNDPWKDNLEKELAIANDLERIRTGDITKEDPKLPKTAWKNIDIRIIDIAPNVYLVNKAARLCIGKCEMDDYSSRIKHIEKLMKLGHESILEHSNIISLVRIPRNTLCLLGIFDVNALINCLTECKYLNIATTMDIECINFLIGGSIRAYLHAVREIDVDNRMIFIFKDIIKQSIEKEFLFSLTDNKLIDESECTYYPNSKIHLEEYVKDDGTTDLEAVASMDNDPKYVSGKNVDLVYMTDTLSIYREVAIYGFHMLDIYKLATISFLFHDVSRAIGNQLTRHRAGITQESQRYCQHNVDKEKDFIDPIKLHKEHTDRYKDLPDYIEKEFLKSRNYFNIYTYLLQQGVKKEDARAWLPMNVTTKIMMTFTFKNFAKFYSLRSAKAAQLEIQLLANQCKDLLVENTNDWVIKEKFCDMFINDNTNYRAKFNLIDYDFKTLNDYNGTYGVFFKNHNMNVSQSVVKIDEDDNNISTEVVEKETTINVEDMKSIDINSVEDAEKYLKQSEEMKNL